MLNSTYGPIPDKKVVILIPSLRQRHNDILKNVEATTPNARVLFLGEEYPSYAKAINAGYKMTQEPFLFTGADDLTFTEGWLEIALEKMTSHTRVVGTNDLGNQKVMDGEHATHYLVDRRYLDEVGGDFAKGPGSFMPECYIHNWTDRDFIEVAKIRGVFAPCLESIVEHNHFTFGKSQLDEVYAKGREFLEEDKQKYLERMKEFKSKS